MEEKKSIIAHFNQIADPRWGAGQRYEQTFLRVSTLMSLMSGSDGYYAIGNFINRNRQALPEHLQPKKGRFYFIYHH